ncbi:hypothetical protein FOL47_010207 [Perkinsus chesapeaki]|uniref:Ubiquitin-like domain-containing protein n=1 Tax=Perkinsus chesapeaki TaxID=330153 RepID=A0A7J6L4N6_PERCH|nr:hypothetical protein FOL47_010207 [Perkinsus chesapeaki]
MPTHLFLGDAERVIPAVTIDAEVSTTIDKIKDELTKGIGFSGFEELLYLDEAPLHDDKALSEINQGNAQDLHLAYRECGEVSVPVKRLNGEAVTISIRGSDTVATIKDKIEGVTGIPPGEQVIAVAGSIRQDGQAIADYLKRQLTRHVIVHQFATVTIHQRPLTYGDRDIAFDVTPSTTIGQVKRILKDKWNVPLTRQKISSTNGEPISDSVTVRDCGIEDEGFLILNLKARGELHAHAEELGGGWESVSVMPSHTVDMVNEAVELSTGFPARNQRIMFGGKEVISGRLSDYIPEQSASVYLGINRPVRVNITDLSDKKVFVSIKPWGRIEEVKRELWRNGYRIKSQLFYDGKELDDCVRLSDGKLRQVRRGAQLRLFESVRGPRRIVNLKSLWGQITSVGWYEHDTVKDLKLRIHDATGKHPQMQSLVFKGKELRDGALLRSCGLRNNETVHLVIVLQRFSP